MGKPHQRTVLEDARDRLFAEIHRCGVKQASDDDVAEWLDDTIDYLGDEYPSLSGGQLGKLKLMGQNYVAPAIPHGAGKDATTRDEWSDAQDEGLSNAA